MAEMCLHWEVEGLRHFRSRTILMTENVFRQFSLIENVTYLVHADADYEDDIHRENSWAGNSSS